VLLHNGFYGHRSVLSAYAGQKSPGQPIFGSVIHGWFPVPEMEYVSTARWSDRVPLFVWNQRHMDWMRQHHVKNVHLLGSPFAYLVGDSETKLGIGDGTLVLPGHSSGDEGTEIDFNRFRRLVEESSSPPWTIVAYYQDYQRLVSSGIHREDGWRLASFGHRHDPAFLPRLVDCFARHRSIVSTTLGSGFLYGMAIGLEPIIIPPVDLNLLSVELKDPVLVDFLQGLVEGTTDTECSTSFARDELGFDARKSPEDLTDLLGWKGIRRPVASALGWVAHRTSGSKAIAWDMRYPYPGPIDESSSA
jgi:hypothetical protein